MLDPARKAPPPPWAPPFFFPEQTTDDVHESHAGLLSLRTRRDPMADASFAGRRSDPAIDDAEASGLLAPLGPLDQLELLDGHQHGAGLGALARAHHAALLEQVHDAPGPGEARPSACAAASTWSPSWLRTTRSMAARTRASSSSSSPSNMLPPPAPPVGRPRPRRRSRTRARAPGASSGRRPCAPLPRSRRRPGCAAPPIDVGPSSSMSPLPTRRSAPGWSRMTRLSVRLDTANAMRAGMFALITPVSTLTLGRWVATTRWMPDGAGHLGDAGDGVLHVAGRHHHEVVQLVDDHDDERQALVRRLACPARASARPGRTRRCSR